MKRVRFALLLPLCAILVTTALWRRARSEFLSSGLDVPMPLQVAGMLNGPVAVLASPCYRFSHGDVTAWRPAFLLLAVALQWAYIGRLMDRQRESSRLPSSRGYIAGVLGVLFALGPLIAGFTTNVGLIYKAVALAWSLLMVYHFTGFFSKRTSGGVVSAQCDEWMHLNGSTNAGREQTIDYKRGPDGRKSRCGATDWNCISRPGFRNYYRRGAGIA